MVCFSSYSMLYICLYSGMVELLSRLSSINKFIMMTNTTTTLNNKTKDTKENGNIPNVATMETLLRVLDSSGGKEKLIRADRRSVSVRKFNFLK